MAAGRIQSKAAERIGGRTSGSIACGALLQEQCCRDVESSAAIGFSDCLRSEPRGCYSGAEVPCLNRSRFDSASLGSCGVASCRSSSSRPVLVETFAVRHSVSCALSSCCVLKYRPHALQRNWFVPGLAGEGILLYRTCDAGVDWNVTRVSSCGSEQFAAQVVRSSASFREHLGEARENLSDLRGAELLQRAPLCSITRQ